MKKEMTLASALKEKTRILEKLNEVRNQIGEYNAVDDRSESPVDVSELLIQEETLEENLIRIKTVIAQGNIGIARQITSMMNIRARIIFYENLDCTSVRMLTGNDGSGVKVPRDVCLTKREVLKKVSELKQKLNDLQDEVDQFNATHKVEVEFL